MHCHKSMSLLILHIVPRHNICCRVIRGPAPLPAHHPQVDGWLRGARRGETGFRCHIGCHEASKACGGNSTARTTQKTTTHNGVEGGINSRQLRGDGERANLRDQSSWISPELLPLLDDEPVTVPEMLRRATRTRW